LGGCETDLETRFLAGGGRGDVEEDSVMKQERSRRPDIADLLSRMRKVASQERHKFAVSKEPVTASYYSAYLHDVSNATLTFQKRQPLSECLTHVASILSLFMSPELFESFIGDLEERYAAILKQQSPRSAQLWFWRQVVQSLLPLAFAAIRRVSGFERFVEFYRRKRS
jgi:hypothetical protein